MLHKDKFSYFIQQQDQKHIALNYKCSSKSREYKWKWWKWHPWFHRKLCLLWIMSCQIFIVLPLLMSESFVINYQQERQECSCTVFLVSMCTSIPSGVWSCPQHRWVITLTDGWAPPIPHCDDLSLPKPRSFVACVFEWKEKWKENVNKKHGVN